MSGEQRFWLVIVGLAFLCSNRWGTRLERLRTWGFELLGAACIIAAILG